MRHLSAKELKLEEEKLYKEYKEKLNKLKKVEKEDKAVGQIFTKGLLPIYIFYILSIGDTNGNDISHKISEGTNHLWTPSTGGIYPLLKKMEKNGYIQGTWDNDKKPSQKIYKLTELGKEEFDNRKHLLKENIENSLEVFKIIYSDLYR